MAFKHYQILLGVLLLGVSGVFSQDVECPIYRRFDPDDQSTCGSQGQAPCSSGQGCCINKCFYECRDLIYAPNPCRTDPCQHGGKCVNETGDYHCLCPEGHHGKNCEMLPDPVCPQWPSVDECPPQEDIEMDSDCYPGKSPCPAGLGCCRHGCYFECKELVYPPYPCRMNPCQHGGKCMNEMGDYHCWCPEGHHGKNCEIVPDPETGECPIPRPVSECPAFTRGSEEDKSTCGLPGQASCPSGQLCCQDKCFDSCRGDLYYGGPCGRRPCRNGGVCLAYDSYYQCSCPPGYVGKDCETFQDPSGQDIDECQISYCEKGENCSSLPGQYSCPCPEGVEIKKVCSPGPSMDECPPLEYVESQSDCYPGKSSCPSGYRCCLHGCYFHCKVPGPKRPTGPCMNGGKCFNTNGSYSCGCAQGYEGRHCEKDVDECLLNPCANGGKCINNKGSYTCTCPSGFEGSNCWRDKDECSLWWKNPCRNGATCTNTYGDYKCTCIQGYTGKYCEKDIDECLQDPCQKCFNTLGSYRCGCPLGFHGENCEEDINECSLGRNCVGGLTCSNTRGGYVCSNSAIKDVQKPLDEVRYSAIGCYKDVSGARAMPVKLGHFPGGMTREARKKVVEKCAAAVKRRGYKYFGIQSYHQCWSGSRASNDYDKYGKEYRPSKCRHAWGVGGHLTNMVYRLD